MSGPLADSRWAWLEHPLVGIDRRWSAVALGYCLLTVVSTAVALWLYAGGVDHVPGWWVRIVDGFTAVLIIGAVLSATVLPAVYALRNGGPVMAVTVGLIPYLSGGVLYLDYTLTNDLVVALIGASFGAVVAVGVMWRRHTRETDTMAPGPTLLDGLFFATAVSLVSLIGAWRFSTGAPADTVATIDPLQWLVVVPLIGCVMLWALTATSTEGLASVYSEER